MLFRSGVVTSLNGLRIVTESGVGRFMPVTLSATPAMENFDAALRSINEAYGADTAGLVLTSLEVDAE